MHRKGSRKKFIKLLKAGCLWGGQDGGLQRGMAQGPEL